MSLRLTDRFDFPTDRLAVVAASIVLLALLIVQGLAAVQSFHDEAPALESSHVHHAGAYCSHEGCTCTAESCNHEHGDGHAFTSCGQQDLAAVASHFISITPPARSVSLLPPTRSARLVVEASHLSDQTSLPAVFHPPRIA